MSFSFEKTFRSKMVAKNIGDFSFYSPTLFFVVLVFFVVQIPTTNAVSYCPFYKDRQPVTFVKRCPEICCQNIVFPRENQTCCRMRTETTVVTVTLTYFGYKWWTILLFAICSFLALSILIHLYKRFCLVKRMTVGPSTAFTISKDVAEQNNGTGTAGIILVEDNPPNYSNAERPATPAPPAYVTIDVAKLA